MEEMSSYERKLKLINKIYKLPAPSKNLQGFEYDEFSLPIDEPLARDPLQLLEETHATALPNLLRLIPRAPDNAFITIGRTYDPIQRSKNYDARKEYFKRTEFDPPVLMQEQILYSSNHAYNSAMVEYYMQSHISKGLWKKHFPFVNPHATHAPVNSASYTARACYVYILKPSEKKAKYQYSGLQSNSNRPQTPQNKKK
ncbi:hypothetical protein PVAND_017719 [Polypedilum vanderplanki]|uniref:Uncharacterized protein n=1 Tax=Polypedilum vanderplanki TaxID=319348 RepID=A0A9J6B8T0_POLVA|nr:hypothetical protein PVAND_017719 [Polypedilum vanderplanki]